MESDNLSRGIMLFNVGQKCLIRLVVCLRTLRRHYDGNVLLVVDGHHDSAFLEALKKEFGIQIISTARPDSERALLKKMWSCTTSPYDITVFLDSDTVVLGDVSELFEMAKGRDLVATHFAGWSSAGKMISGRIDGYAPYRPAYVEAAKAYGPAINTGVFAWSKGSRMFKEWIDTTTWGFDNGMYIADEVACQLLLPRYNCVVADKKFNVSVLHDPGTPDPRILHFHGKKHCIEAEKCSFWLEEFVEALKVNSCGIRDMVTKDQCLDDRRLRKFIYGNEPTMHADVKSRIKSVLGMAPSETWPGFKNDEVTIVTACDPKYVEHLKVTLPNWIRHKHVDRFPMIVYVNGFRRWKRNDALDFLRAMPNVKLIPWDMENAADQRERMLTAFVLGTARDVTTPYWVKIDADAFATDDEPLLTPEMKNYVICGHRWGYSFVKHMGPLIDWANTHPAFAQTPKDAVDPACVDGRKYFHPGKRVASYVQFHKSDFVRMAAQLAGNRLPVPSHDTYLWYVADRLKLPIMQHNFKRHRGMSNKSDAEELKRIVAEIDIVTPMKEAKTNEPDYDDQD